MENLPGDEDMRNSMLAAVQAAPPVREAPPSLPTPEPMVQVEHPITMGLIVSAHPTEAFRADGILSALRPGGASFRRVRGTDIVDEVLSDLLASTGADRMPGSAHVHPVMADEDDFIFSSLDDDFPSPAPRDHAGSSVHSATVEFRGGEVIHHGHVDLVRQPFEDLLPPGPRGTPMVHTLLPVPRYEPRLSLEGRTTFRPAPMTATADPFHLDGDDDFPMPPRHDDPEWR